MLIDFKVKNFKSFKDGFDLSMKPSRVRDLNDSILFYGKNESTKKGLLSSSVIYGPNASGKSTIIEAFSRLKNIVLNGNIDNDVVKKDFLYSNKLELIPFFLNEEAIPVEFNIEFEYKNNIINYLLSIMFGRFAANDQRKIVNEYLKFNSKSIFERSEDKINIFYENVDKDFLNEGYSTAMYQTVDLLINLNVETNKLFLSNDFPSFISKKMYNDIIDWFQDKLRIINNFDDFHFELDSKNKINMPHTMYDSVSKIGVLATNMMYQKKDEEKDDSTLYSTLKTPYCNVELPSKIIESKGTLRFIDLFPIIYQTIVNGYTLIIDEMDCSLHPMVIMSIVNIFHNPNINKKKAQLIFNTHNPVFLNNKIFRRDEMCFVEKNSETKTSEFYKLSDFLTNSSTSTRNTTDYLDNYFKNKYGAIEYVDLSDIFEKIMENVE